MLAFDRDLALADLDLHEESITFPPSYPYSETDGQPRTFLNKRCPGWCDRVLVTDALQQSTESQSYQLVGRDVCMGDHKVWQRLAGDWLESAEMSPNLISRVLCSRCSCC